MNKNFEIEQNELLEYLVYNLIYPKFSKQSRPNHSIGLELFITNTCNKRCEYCYLQKHKELYPSEINNNDTIRKNCQILLNHLLEKKVTISKLDLFSGEIIGFNELWFDIIDIIVDFSKKGLNVNTILVPSNASFLLNEKTRNRMEKLIQDLNKEGIHLVFSISDDGALIDEINRPLTSGEKQQKELFYKEAKKFAKKYGFGFHPMVNAYSIEKWVDNFKWWEDYLKDFPSGDPLSNALFLEVRDNDWTDEKIEHYIKFLKVAIESMSNNKSNLTKEDLIAILCDRKEGHRIQTNKKINLPFLNNYLPFGLSVGDRISCSITQSFCVRLGDLSICPCHRTAYDHLLYGKYQVKNDKIIGIQANNVQLFINNMITGSSGFFMCDTCVISDYCQKGCRGAQYENFKDISLPIPSVCNLMKVKAMYCFINIIYFIEQYDMKNLKDYSRKYSIILNNIKEEDKEFYEKWKKIISQNLLEI